MCEWVDITLLHDCGALSTQMRQSWIAATTRGSRGHIAASHNDFIRTIPSWYSQWSCRTIISNYRVQDGPLYNLPESKYEFASEELFWLLLEIYLCMITKRTTAQGTQTFRCNYCSLSNGNKWSPQHPMYWEMTFLGQSNSLKDQSDVTVNRYQRSDVYQLMAKDIFIVTCTDKILQ